MKTDAQAAPAPDASTAVSEAIEALTETEIVQPEEELQTEEAPEEVEAELEQEVAEEAEAPAADAEFDALVDEAVNVYGLPKEMVEGLGDNIGKVLAALDRQASQIMRDELAAKGETEPQRETEERREAKAESAKPVGALGKFELAIDRDVHDEDTLKAFDSLAEQINQDREFINNQTEVMRQMATLLVETHGTVASTTKQAESQTHATFSNDMDDFFATLGEDFASVYGTEPISSLPGNSPKIAARNALVAEMSILRESDGRAKRASRPTKAQAARALRVLHEDKAHTIARRDVEKQITSRRKAAIARPSGRTTRKGDPRQNAMAAIEKFLPKLGL